MNADSAFLKSAFLSGQYFFLLIPQKLDVHVRPQPHVVR
jgi:hypothetical protein